MKCNYNRRRKTPLPVPPAHQPQGDEVEYDNGVLSPPSPKLRLPPPDSNGTGHTYLTIIDTESRDELCRRSSSEQSRLSTGSDVSNRDSGAGNYFASYDDKIRLESPIEESSRPRSLSSTDIHRCSWFFGNLSREKVSDLMKQNASQNGTFLVRTSVTGGIQFPYTLCVNYGGKQFNVQIGLRRVNPSVFSLGKPKADERQFNTVPELVQFYHCQPLELYKKDKLFGSVILQTVSYTFNK